MTPSSLPSRPDNEKKSSLPSRGAVPHLPDGVTVGDKKFDKPIPPDWDGRCLACRIPMTLSDDGVFFDCERCCRTVHVDELSW